MTKALVIAVFVATVIATTASAGTPLHFTSKAAAGFQGVLRHQDHFPTAVCLKASARHLHCYHMIQSRWVVTFDARPATATRMRVLIIASRGGHVSKKTTAITALKGWIRG